MNATAHILPEGMLSRFSMELDEPSKYTLAQQPIAMMSLDRRRSDSAQEDDESYERRRDAGSIARTVFEALRAHTKFIGPGIVMSVAFIDVGNFASALGAGASKGYSPLFVILLASVMAIYVQILACRLGVVSGLDLAQHCRRSLYNRPTYTMAYRSLMYLLWFINEAAIILTDLAELLGSSIAINLMAPAIPLWAASLISFADVVIVLFFFSDFPSSHVNRSVHAFELVVGSMVLIVFVCFIILTARIQPHWGDVFKGYLPSSNIIRDDGLYISVAIIGAVVMPHSIVLGSKLATIDRGSTEGDKTKLEATDGLQSEPVQSGRHLPALHMPNPRTIPQGLTLPSARSAGKTSRFGFLERTTEPRADRAPTIEFVRSHLPHVATDIALSLIAFALVINSLILIVAGAAFYHPLAGQTSDAIQGVQDGNLFSAYGLIRDTIGKAFGYIFAISLLFSGLSASVTATLAGQVVGEGFLNLKVRPFVRRLITRGISIIPAIVVSASVGASGLSTLLVASQVALSLILPFVIWPLLCFTSNADIMTISDGSTAAPTAESSTSHGRFRNALARLAHPFAPASSKPGRASFVNSPAVIIIGWAIWAIICICNLYALTQI
ncbi:uncharacterized protein L969DRAFT_573969 [Mixia osmundae IAM 14324]|uniref:uncharacterized protein n=1 Tax=Mixia osmundae (strain CBS 9802 / IAM 14324 / JCM 22182 / KY 12970) TaxID=764103 RepID=UPI0004A54FCC|nr:uncharacterized protein L969DRAFT_573969 [Mixia osmundae IAM 14324]KEI37505.1 hypothetical protein L969DRAFT_573969 [Mixia osmundae IAM 14324]